MFMQDYRKLIKPKFEKRYKELLKDRYEDFISCSLKKPTRSIRVNTLKIKVEELKNRMKQWSLEQVPWCSEGFWIKHKKAEREDVGNTIEHCLGYYYVQDAASMIPPIVLDPKPGDNVLDMCASPGSKASQIAQMMKNRGCLVANDYKGIRLAPLGINMQRMGVTNVIITLMEGWYFKGYEFDKILVDVPCSGTGTVRKSLKTLTEWSPGLIKHLTGAQRKLLETAFKNLKKGGVLVYSTCSVEPDENEGVVSWLLEKYDNAQVVSVKVPGLKISEPILEFEKQKFNPQVDNCLRIWPHDNDTEGFFVAKIKRG